MQLCLIFFSLLVVKGKVSFFIFVYFHKYFVKLVISLLVYMLSNLRDMSRDLNVYYMA